jgi:hypothetical protein
MTIRWEAEGEDKNLILTHTGRMVDPFNLRHEDIDIEDIAHALSHICRFTGHCSSHYSVAEHSVMVSELVPPEHALAGLMHDAVEAYIGDIATPIKHRMEVNGEPIRDVEDRQFEVVADVFGLTLPLDPCVKAADKKAFFWEMETVMCGLSAGNVHDPYDMFMNRFRELTE